jgi:hypothetical protein
MIDGYGQWGAKDYTSTACASDGTTIISYLPAGRQVTIDLSKITGKKARCWWYNPGNGTATYNGTFPSEGVWQFIPPSEGDWILVIDDTSSKYPPPGKERLF